jgi:multidrug efflux pump subunit AcrA (membrane-fusion protein)
MSDRSDVFRKVALERLSSPEQLDELLQVTRLSGWLVLATVALVIAAAGAWAVLGSVPVTSPGEGVLMPAVEPVAVLLPRPALVGELAVREGDAVVAGQPLARLHSTAGDGGEGEWWTLTAPADGRVYEILAAPGDRLATATPLVRLEPPATPLAAALFLPTHAAPLVTPGMPVRVWPQDDGGGRGARVGGTVARVTALPASARGLERQLDDPRLADRLAARGLWVRVDVRLDERAAAAAGWTPRLAVEGVVVRGRERPIAYIIPWLRGAGGED